MRYSKRYSVNHHSVSIDPPSPAECWLKCGSVATPEQGRESSRCTVPPLCSEQVKLLRERQLLTVDIFRLLFTQHMNQLDATQDHAGTVSGLEAEHRSH